MIGKWLATAMVNGLLFLVAGAVAINVAYRLTNSPALLFLILNVAVAAAGALTRAWSKQPSTVAFPASVVSIALIRLLAMEVYLGDGGDPRIMCDTSRAWWAFSRLWRQLDLLLGAGRFSASYVACRHTPQNNEMQRTKPGPNGASPLISVFGGPGGL